MKLPLLVGGAGTADAIAIAASSIVAPTAHVSLGAVHKHPKAPGIRAELQAVVRLVGQRFGKRRGDTRERGGPANLRGIAFELEPILALHEAAKDGYLEPGVQGLHVPGLDGLAAGGFFDHVAEEFAEAPKLADFGGARWGRGEAPELEEIGDPLRV